MSYWKTFYADKIGNNDFIEGIIAAIEAYSVWQSGKRYIGSPERELKSVISEIKKDLHYIGKEKL